MNKHRVRSIAYGWLYPKCKPNTKASCALIALIVAHKNELQMQNTIVHK